MQSLFGARAQAAADLSALALTNPFTPDRVALEAELLGDAFEDPGPTWSLDPGLDVERPNLVRLRGLGLELAAAARARLVEAGGATPQDLLTYENLCLYNLYERFEDEMFAALSGPAAARLRPAPFARFAEAYEAALGPAWDRGFARTPAALGFGLLWQLRRAFHFIHRRILGVAPASAALRAQVWQSVFTQDVGRYRRGLYARMHELSTLVLGPSGTGKELVAEAIGASRFIPFDAAEGRFEDDFAALFQPVHLAALTESLVEAELFGHEKGAFTGAHQARPGYLEGRSPAFTVFLDEIGEVPPTLQVKLLRVLQSREFARVGGVERRRFEGKVVAATHRDLPALIREGRFREDLYYRLCADVVETPRLFDILEGQLGRLEGLARALAGRLVDAGDLDGLVEQVVGFVGAQLGPEYPWPGNIRELEQVIRNVLVRGHYRPPDAAPRRDPEAAVLEQIRAGQLSAEALLSRYATLVYAQEGSFEGTARRLQIDRRTVKRHLDAALLAALRGERGP